MRITLTTTIKVTSDAGNLPSDAQVDEKIAQKIADFVNKIRHEIGSEFEDIKHNDGKLAEFDVLQRKVVYSQTPKEEATFSQSLCRSLSCDGAAMLKISEKVFLEPLSRPFNQVPSHSLSLLKGDGSKRDVERLCNYLANE
jgi:hypothetical protein